MLLKSTTKIDCKSIVSTLMKNPITHENMFKIRSKSTDLIIKKEIALTLLEDLLNCIFTSGHLLLKKARYKVIKSSNQIKIKITANLTEEDGFRKLATISNHKNSYFYSCKYLKNHNWQLFLVFFLFAFSFNYIQKEKQEKLLWSVGLVYLLFLKTHS